MGTFTFYCNLTSDPQCAKMKGTLELHMLAPNRFLNVIEMGGVGRMSQGFDGTVGWSMNPVMGTQLLEGRSLEELRRSSDFYRELAARYGTRPQ